MSLPTVLITRPADDYTELARALAAIGRKLVGKSFIRTISVAFGPLPPDADWLFFLSPAAVGHFYSQIPALPRSFRLAAMGEGTARALSRYGVASFTGSDNRTERAVAEFLTLPDMGPVCFIEGEGSLSGVQSAIPVDRCYRLIVYRKEPLHIVLDYSPEAVVFSSPSNVRAFLRNNVWDPACRAISFGPSTSAALHHASIRNVTVSDGTNENDLLRAIFAALGV